MGMKLGLLVTLAAVSGVGLGRFSQSSDYPVLLMALPLVLIGLWALARWWVLRPMEHLLRKLELLARTPDYAAMRALPTERGDEIGVIARHVQQLALQAIQQRMQANSLRRTLETRVTRATRQATRKLRSIALRDPLTKLGNRRYLDENLDSLVHLAQAGDVDLTCIMMDMDDFKAVNDTHGHAMGDQLLVFLASLIRACVRKDDLAVRMGGDEFVVFLPGVSGKRACEFVQAVQTMFRQQVRVLLKNGPLPDLSFGMASLHADQCATAGELLNKADQYLYQAKHTGKGRCCGSAE